LRLSRRSLLLTVAALPLVGCGDGGTISQFETSGDTARPGGRGLAQPVRVSYAVRRPALVAAVVRGPGGRPWAPRVQKHPPPPPH
jgi:hypothetical protein